MKLSEIKVYKSLKLKFKSAPQWSKNTAFIVIGVFIALVGVAIINPGHIVQKSLNLVGIDTDTEQSSLAEKSTQTDEAKTSESGDSTTSSDADDSKKTDGSAANSSSKPSSNEPEPTGSNTVITPADLQKLKDSGAPYLIQGTDWKVKINSRLPTNCGSQSSPCPVGTSANVNVSAYNVHTGELLPMTECNGTAAAIHASSNPTPTSLPDAYHCVLSFTPASAGQFWFQVELYLSKAVYTDTIYWGGWVWGGVASDGYFVN